MVTEKDIWQYMEEVADPEIPVISVIDLGVVRKIDLLDQESVNITITPTYSGCPAVTAFSISIRLKLIEKGFKNINVINQLTPTWTTDWMTEEGKQKMKAYGIAPPLQAAHPDGGYLPPYAGSCAPGLTRPNRVPASHQPSHRSPVRW